MINNFKFRVWDKNSKQYALNTEFYINNDGDLLMWSKATHMDDETLIYCDKKDFIVEFFTGLTVNGVDIYEGDICKVHQFTMELGASLGVYEGEREFIAVVKFSEFGVSFNDELYSDLNFEDIDEQIELLGSIHTHKHLLEGE